MTGVAAAEEEVARTAVVLAAEAGAGETMAAAMMEATAVVAGASPGRTLFSL